MSQENVESLRRAVEAFNGRDRPAWLALCDPELENYPPRDWPESAPIQGREAVWDFYVEGIEPWERGVLRLTEEIEAGDDQVVAHLRGEMQGKASGVGVTWSFWQVITFRDGRAVRIRWFADRAEALEAAGLRE